MWHMLNLDGSAHGAAVYNIASHAQPYEKNRPFYFHPACRYKLQDESALHRSFPNQDSFRS
jgi:hypothetical protein